MNCFRQHVIGMTYLCLGIYTVICLQRATEVILKAGKYKYVSKKTTATAAAKSLQSCPTLCDPIDSSPPGSPIPGIL